MSIGAIWEICILLLLPTAINSIRDRVYTRSGSVIGSTVYCNSVAVKRYLGIPYAQPPVQDLRFKKTVPVKNWRSPLIANTSSPACVQVFPYEYPWIDKESGKSEDCLYLNIWAPANGSKSHPKAVMFWIHGGGFSFGSNSKPLYDGGNLAAAGDVIVVTINYRLGVFGFLSTGNDDAPGNMGLFDILEALKWVNNNIQAFGGNTKRITVIGESAGSVVAGYLCVSPLSRGLFQQVIMQSGAPMDIKLDAVKKNLKLGQRLAEAVGCADGTTITENPHEVVKCLKKKDAMDLAFAVNSFDWTSINTFIPIYGDSFLPKDPTEEIRAGNFQDVEVLIGALQDEGSFKLVSYKPNVFGPFGELNPKINKSYGEELIRGIFVDFEDRDAVVNYYLGDLRDNEYDLIRNQVYHAMGDFRIFCPTLYFAESFSKKGNVVFFYYYNHQSSITPWAKWMGVTHASEVDFVFGRPLDESSNFMYEEKALSKYMIRAWTQFVKYGFPSFDWNLFRSSDPCIHQIGASDSNYLSSHLNNCNFYRKYFEI